MQIKLPLTLIDRKGAVLATSVGLLSACATQPVDPNRLVTPTCDQSVDCFYERNIRSFRVLDNRTVIVLVGRDQCPFKLEVDGVFCDLGMASFIGFNDTDGRICTWDRTFMSSGPFARDGEYCRVSSVTPMTDDEVLEAYANEGLLEPLPAKGAGELEVDDEAESPQGDTELAPTNPTDEAP